MPRVHAESLFALAPGFFDGARIYAFSVDCDADGSGQGALRPDGAEERAVELGEAAAGDEDLEDSRLSKWTCGACGMKFQNGEDQRGHFKSDFHRLNVKRKIAGKACFTEEEFERFAGGDIAGDTDVSSVSGSESDVEDEEKHSSKNVAGKVIIPLLLGSGSIVEVWSCLVLNSGEKLEKQKDDQQEAGVVTETVFLSRLKSLVSSPKLVWVVLLAVGGHFAGVVVDIKTGVVQAHQTYHRYVVRAKAGGKQANRDATGRAPKSAGASLRRYNEMALQKEIKTLLESWRDYLQEASCIFVFAPSRNSQSIVGDKPLLSREDSRLRSIPFPTRRPTYKEARRVYGRLSSLQYKEKEEVLSVPDEAPPPSTEKSEKKVTVQHERSNTDLDAAAEENAAAQVPPPPLHEAVVAGNAALVMDLLESGADPCVKHRGRTAYAAASHKETRNAFRKFMASHLDMWDWNAANVPSPLTDEMEAAQAAKQAEKTAKRRAKEKERKLERKAQQKAAAAAEVSKKPGTSAPKEVPTQEAMNATQRELRAAAAESRMKASMTSAGSSELCSCCASSLANKVPFYKFEFKYCSVACVNAHRRILEDE
ncbi:ankyrin repeat and zinc finger domain-containing protein 1-like [Selaginella moellendorffii]|uniref:ankyrin repeat and zinc finger domain-containing protein 1-like n=1 Tax=Selaginella moellendorffii TaxID=88036 RepID=UPI000D1CA5E8|nr:ankyrin repeat and zinc finger domain-containing protein 1-like [Selaginella moellendorffii]|eukprot:XP_024534796.1 ankyrin repeat and zinc finger domain-containing protein 1-like [Selaginella moellendorffii]